MTPWHDLASLARLAPTPHNTQPFRVRPKSATDADIVMMCDRLLPEEDHGNLYVPSAFGIFAATLERAGRHFGRVVDVRAVDALDTASLSLTSGAVVVGRARITGDCAREAQDALLDARRTSRLPYHDRDVAPDVIAKLGAIAERAGHRMIVHGDRETVQPLLHLNASAIIDNLQLGSEREEIRGWYRYGATPAHGDGLWTEPMNQPAWEMHAAFGTPWAFKLPGLRAFAIHRYLKTQAGTRQIALLCGPFAKWPELVSAGRMLLELWLAMAAHGIYVQPFGSMLTNAVYAKKVADTFAVTDCWLIMRLGYSDAPPRAPRLESIVIE